MGKIVQKVKILYVSKNSDSSLKLDFSGQNKSRVMLVSKIESRKCINRFFTQNDVTSLLQKMLFLTEACFEIMRPQLDSWCRNESSGGLSFWFRTPVDPGRKSKQTQIDNFSIVKCDF